MSAEINSSNMNYVSVSTPQVLFWSIESYRKAVIESGYNGLEWHPIRLIPGMQFKIGAVNTESKRRIASLHQSWRSERTLPEVIKHPNRALAGVSFAILPHRDDSLEDMARVQQVVGRKLLAVLYPDTAPYFHHIPFHIPFRSLPLRFIPFRDITFQPTPEVMADWGVDNLHQLFVKMFKLGYDGFCVDTYHLRRLSKDNKAGLNPWQDTLPKLLRKTQEVHISAGRVDMMDPNIDTLAELNDLLCGTESTDLPKIVRMIKESGWTGPMVTEIPAQAIALVTGKKFVSTDQLIETHQTVVKNIRQLLT